jgi:hypothetical protein
MICYYKYIYIYTHTIGECPRVTADVHIQRIEILHNQLVRVADHGGGHLVASTALTAEDPDLSTTYEIVFLCTLITIEHLNSSSSTRSLKIYKVSNHEF